MEAATTAPRGMQGLLARGWCETDIPHIVELMIRCGEEYNPLYNWRRNQSGYIEWLTDTVDDEWHHFHMVRCGNVTIAVAGLASSQLSDYDGHVHSVYVDPAFRRRGLGRLATESVLHYARSVGMESVEMGISTNLIAKQLYEKMGFKVVQSDDVMAMSL